MKPSEQEINEAHERFIQGRTWNRRRQVVCDFRLVLLTDATERRLAYLVEQAAAEAAEMPAQFQGIREPLARARHLGIEKAFADLMS